MLRYWAAFLLLGFCAACMATSTDTPPIETSASVTINAPSIGTVIYSDRIYVAGTADALPENNFQLEVATVADEVLGEAIIEPQNGEWNVQLPHNYTGDPTEITIRAYAEGAEAGTEYDIAAAVLSPADNRPEGTYGLILQPSDGDTAGGEQIPLFGVISGIDADELIVRLIMGDEIITEQIISVDYPNRADEIPWQADLSTSERTGPVTITVGYADAEDGFILLDEVSIVLTAIAG